jgi:hypothetical protein
VKVKAAHAGGLYKCIETWQAVAGLNHPASVRHGGGAQGGRQ